MDDILEGMNKIKKRLILRKPQQQKMHIKNRQSYFHLFRKGKYQEENHQTQLNNNDKFL